MSNANRSTANCTGFTRYRRGMAFLSFGLQDAEVAHPTSSSFPWATVGAMDGGGLCVGASADKLAGRVPAGTHSCSPLSRESSTVSRSSFTSDFFGSRYAESAMTANLVHIQYASSPMSDVNSQAMASTIKFRSCPKRTSRSAFSIVYRCAASVLNMCITAVMSFGSRSWRRWLPYWVNTDR